jgi:hypothetical protein
LNDLIDSNNICTNDLILAELIPSINLRKERRLKDLLLILTRKPINIDWDRIIRMQTANLRNGINKVGIADLIVAQNAIDGNLELYTLDKHFTAMSELHGLRIYQPR